MEEILASIRRIISEDDAPEEKPAGLPPAPAASEAEDAAAARGADLSVPDEEESVGSAAFDDAEELELTDRVESHGDLDVYSQDAAAAASASGAVETEAPMGELVSAPTAAAASAAFGRLSGAMLMPAAGRTLEDVVRELLRPLLQQWLDENLPGIVQRAVDAEVQRLARGG